MTIVIRWHACRIERKSNTQKMKVSNMTFKNFIVLIVITLITIPCQARWGWTYEQCKEYYGKPVKIWKSKDGKKIIRARFRRTDDVRDIYITTTIVANRVSSITYRCVDNSFMTTETLLAILQAYSDEKENAQFIPLELLMPYDENETFEEKAKRLKNSVVSQEWLLASKKKAATLHAKFIRDAQMLKIVEVALDKDLKKKIIGDKKHNALPF